MFNVMTAESSLRAIIHDSVPEKAIQGEAVKSRREPTLAYMLSETSYMYVKKLFLNFPG